MSTEQIMDYSKHFTISSSFQLPYLRVGTLFSGIGAFEEALKQLKIPHKIVFACDNGEIELIPLDDVKERKEYIDLTRRIRNLDETEKLRLLELKDKVNNRIEEIRKKCFGITSRLARNKYIDSIYQKYEGDRTNWMKISYLANNPHLPKRDFHTDVRFLKGSDYLDKVDIIVGGSPCQSFSTYGKKMGLEDTRGTLFYDYARIIKECQPKIFIYENVLGLLTHDKKRTWQTMLQIWESLGYVLQFDTLNAADYNFPQLRQRLFLIGFRKDIYTKDYKFPDHLDLTHKSSEYLEKGPIEDKYYLGKKGFEWITTVEKNQHRSRVNQDVIGCQTANQQDNWIGDLRIERPQPHHYTDERIHIGKYVFDSEKGPEDAVGRKMTPRECLNLMGFSNKFKIVVKDGIAYRQAGNSIVVPVLMELVKSIIPYLSNQVIISNQDK